MLTGGDLVFGSVSSKRMLEGIETHVAIQQISKAQSEVQMKYTQLSDTVALELSGRIDLLHEKDGKVIVEELKSTYQDLESIAEARLPHIMQAKCYAAMYCDKYDVDEIEVRVTYVSVSTHKKVSISEVHKSSVLINWLRSKCEEILYETEIEVEHKEKRNSSAANLDFPYPEFREGQRNMSGYVYLTSRDRGISLLCAPTGIGKTMGALYPSIKAMGENMGDKVFYLTAKNTIKQVAAESMNMLYDSGFYGRSLLLTAKSKICPYEQQTCHPMYCEQARGYYNRLPDALSDMMASGHYGYDEVVNVAQKHDICPFELSLDFSLKCDVIICDYNHAFDPVAHLKRFFDDGGDYMLLIDEAHNLVGRARDMFSSTLSKKEILDLRRKLPKKPDKVENKIKVALNKINKVLLAYKKGMEYEGISAQTFVTPPTNIESAISSFLDASEPLMDVTIRKSYSPELFEMYFSLKGYLSVSSKFSEYYRCFVINEGRDTKIKILCLDPSTRLQETYNKIRSSVLFSASLVPFSYFSRLLCAVDSENYLLPSPFPPENLKVLVNDTISTKYTNRTKTAGEICENIHSFISTLKGRHMVFFPSYKYMEMVYMLYSEMYDDTEIALQKRNMSDEERTAFLQRFESEKEKPFAAFVVMGGVFAEGIDLVGERLIGAVVVGIGMPQICYERDLIKDYHFENEEPGFAYAYAYPGFNKIIQAVGRIIRTKNDMGAALLIGSRFSHDIYCDLMPPFWHPIKFVRNPKEIAELLEISS